MINTKVSGFTRLDAAISLGLVLVIAIPLWLGVREEGLRARGTERMATVRLIQADLEIFRAKRSSYPAKFDVPTSIGKASYSATPEDCSEDRAVLCTGYVLSFDLDGSIGGLSGGPCRIGPDGISCVE